MTNALCFRCGETKMGAFNRCSSCGKRPVDNYDLALSLVLTDHYCDLQTLRQISEDMQSGIKPRLEDGMREKLLLDVAEFRKTGFGLALFACVSDTEDVPGINPLDLAIAKLWED